MPLISLFSGAETPNTKNIELTREKIQAQSNKIRLSDSDIDAKLDLFCYNHCDNSESDFVKECRGVIFSEDKIIWKGFPYTEEYTTEENSFNKLKEKLDQSRLDKYRFYDSHEGALLRVFYWQNKWYISTHRKLDAFRSKWASKLSFGDMFKSAIEHLYENIDSDMHKYINSLETENNGSIFWKFINSLDKEKHYMFLILNNYDNRIVCQAPEIPVTYHVGTTDLDGNIIDIVLPIQFPHEYKFDSFDSMREKVINNGPVNLQGIVIYDNENKKQYKLFDADYYKLFQVRGNEPSVKYRYLQIRNDKQLVDDLYYLYPKFADAFDDYENTLYECGKMINKYYIDRFIKKKYVTVPKEEYAVMTGCHQWHLEDRTKNRISLRKVIDILNEQPASNLNRIIRRFKNEETKTQLTNQTKTTRLRARSYSHNSDENYTRDRYSRDSRNRSTRDTRDRPIPENGSPRSPTITTNVM